MNIQLINVGFENFVVANKIISVSNAGSSPVKRQIKAAKEKGFYIDLTEGRRTNTIIFSENGGGDLILIAVAPQPQTIKSRINKTKEENRLLNEASSIEREGYIVH
ncbi:extracellular matrix/biofilm biosynthesis regulator RemA family protein [Virgibacillus salexigens]|uniref:DUF370 domain-containing protein n=1 Tax=Virgibacillus massiliensis TaxID=1462526 RepID=A0A024QHL7_9BACI|nr:extracellular matrix/biofilm biosynthesis regulator RemA family protein [Virgibacillus massiliensis]CDQ41757.1 hypothetical protein BN990_04134 [Virgibacillus massiliensis]